MSLCFKAVRHTTYSPSIPTLSLYWHKFIVRFKIRHLTFNARGSKGVVTALHGVLGRKLYCIYSTCTFSPCTHLTPCPRTPVDFVPRAPTDAACTANIWRILVSGDDIPPRSLNALGKDGYRSAGCTAIQHEHQSSIRQSKFLDIAQQCCIFTGYTGSAEQRSNEGTCRTPTSSAVTESIHGE